MLLIFWLSKLANSSPIIFSIILLGYLISENNFHILYDIFSSLFFSKISINKYILSSSRGAISSSTCSISFFFSSISFSKFFTFSGTVKYRVVSSKSPLCLIIEAFMISSLNWLLSPKTVFTASLPSFNFSSVSTYSSSKYPEPFIIIKLSLFSTL